MGGDFAPGNVVAGSIDAVRRDGDLELLLVGPQERIGAELSRLGAEGLPISVVHASEVITMDDGATAALKQKKDSSIAVGLGLQKEGKADAFISAGHTGAVMSASTLILGRVAGVSRPVIGTPLPSRTGTCLLLDAGANVDCKPRHLMEFGVMGSIYTQAMMGSPNPSVGLLNVGEEETKGNEVTLEAHALLKRSKINFIGNVEGRDILSGKAEVVVCDGFVGNVLLKFAESVPGFFKDRVAKFAGSSLLRKMMLVPAIGTLRGAMKSMDYEEYGGVPLLGVKGVSIIGHGKSTPKAIMNMILKAKEMAKKRINDRIEQAMANGL